MAYVRSLQLHRFGLSLGVAFLAASAVGARTSRRLGLTPDEWRWLAIETALVSIVAARIGFVVSDAAYYAAHPIEIVRPPIEGFSFPAGLAAGLAWIARAARRLRLAWLELVDSFALPYLTALLLCTALWGSPIGEAHLIPWGGRVIDPLYLTGVYGLLWWVRTRSEGRRAGALAALVLAFDGALRFALGAAVALFLPGGWSSLGLLLWGRLAIALAAGGALWLLGGAQAFHHRRLSVHRSLKRWSGWLLMYAFLIAVTLVSDG